MTIRRLRQMFFPPDPSPISTPVFSLPDDVRVYAVGDIHGRSTLLAEMLSAIAMDARTRPNSRIIQVFLGDYIDRGLHSRAVIDLLLATPPPGHERICLLGNHEETLLNFLNDPKVLRSWAGFGGYATLASYGIPIPTSMSLEKMTYLRDALRQNLPAEHLIFLRNLDLTYQLGDYLFVHAGILPGVALTAQKPQHLLWIRDAFLMHQGFFDYYVVHGHSPVEVPEIYPNRANIDVSAAAIDSLCCLVIENTERSIMMVTDEKD